MEETPRSLSEALESASMRDIYYPETLVTLRSCTHTDIYYGSCVHSLPLVVMELQGRRRRYPADPRGPIRRHCIMGSGTSASQLSVC